MKIGDKVKAFVQVGLMKEPRWLRGTLVSEGVVEVNGNHLSLERDKIMRWQPLEYENGECQAIKDYADSTWDQLKELVNDAVAHFLPGEKVEVDEKEKTITVHEVSISPGLHEIKTIAAFREMPTWNVSYWKYIPSTRWEPPDADEVDCGHGGPFQAARILVDTILKFSADAYWDSLADEEAARLYEGG